MLAPAIDEFLPTESDAGDGFPSGIEVARRNRRRRPGESGRAGAVEQWTCMPRSVAEVVAVVNWACRNDWNVRAAGVDTTPPDEAGTLLVNLSRHMNRARIDGHADSGEPSTVTAQTGITVDALLTQLEREGYGLALSPASGGITLGSALASGGHDAISSLIESATVVVWDAGQRQYVARTVHRADPRISALLVHQGRALILAATLTIEPARRLRCLSRTDLDTSVVFARPQTSGPGGPGSVSFAGLLERCDRIESVWYPFTPAPWLKLWNAEPQRPSTAREVGEPYNYPFADAVDERQAELIRQLIDGEGWVTPLFGGHAYAATVGGLHATRSADLWGWAKNTQLYVRPTALRFTRHGYAVLTTRQRVQYVVSTFYTFLIAALDRYRAEGRFPVNGPWELRVTQHAASQGPIESGANAEIGTGPGPDADLADAGFDTVVWLDVLTMPGTLDAPAFYAELDAWITTAFDRPHEQVRRQPAGQQPAALAILDRLDPHRVFARRSRRPAQPS